MCWDAVGDRNSWWTSSVLSNTNQTSVQTLCEHSPGHLGCSHRKSSTFCHGSVGALIVDNADAMTMDSVGAQQQQRGSWSPLWCWVHLVCKLVPISYHEQQWWNHMDFQEPFFSTVIYVNFFLLKDDQRYEQVLQDLCCAVSLFNVTLNHQPQVQIWICQCALQRNMHRKLRSVLKIVFTITSSTPISAGKTAPERNTAPP